MLIQCQVPYKEISWPKIKIQAKDLSVNSIQGIYMQKRLSNNSKQNHEAYGPHRSPEKQSDHYTNKLFIDTLTHNH